MSDVNFVPKNLANGVSPLSKTALYSVPVGKYAMTRSIIMVNTSGSTVTVNVYVSIQSATSRRVVAKDLSIAAGASASIDLNLTLSGGDAIEMDSSSAGAIDYVVNGVESQ